MTTDVADWRQFAACRHQAREMVPGPDDRLDPLMRVNGVVDDQGRAAVLAAKKTCRRCPVRQHCLRQAQDLAVRYGSLYVQGVWAGLTGRERDTWHGLGTPPRPCSQCRLLCVPIHLATTVCNVCDPRQRPHYDDYRELAIPLISAGQALVDVAQMLRLDPRSLAGACVRWRIQPLAVGKRGRRPSKPCGTLAAKERHRKNGQSWHECACSAVPWRRGKPRTKTPTDE